MEIPIEVAVMTLPGVTLFPQALLPLHIFEPRYQQMLADVLHGERMFIVAMQKPGSVREIPSAVAGLGIVRVCVDNPDGTSHLILQGISRVELKTAVRYRPYRINRIRALHAPARDSVTIDALMAKVRDLVSERIELGLPSPGQFKAAMKSKSKPNAPVPSIREIFNYLEKVTDPDQAADLISCTLLPRASHRQTILETVEVEPRLKHLIHFLMAEITEHRKNKKNE